MWPLKLCLKKQSDGGALQMVKLRCAKCSHFYRTMVGDFGMGYNPAPSCHRYEDTGRRPNILTQDCFELRKQRTKRDLKYV